MYSIVYVSTASKLYGEAELEEILRVSRSWNHSVGITGLLLYKEGYFMQFLEGEKADVLELLAMIKSDPRHHSMIVINQQDAAEREFGLWSMGFKRLLPSNPPPQGFTDLWELPFSSEEFLADPTRTLQFLLGFKETVH
jgi:hypothetical protein